MEPTDDLRRRGLIKKFPPEPGAVENAMALARRDATVAGTMLAGNADWAYTIAYNAMLQAGRALMFSKGYRPAGTNQHIAVVRFTELYLDREAVLAFDRMRRKRHITVYDMAGTVSEGEARNAVARAEAFLETVEGLLA
ncbi:HEPN domain-containing protein [Methanofollis aquaemaris]|uniref:HEPN domain-containing protein n=1 Tax=Methanofollis aquaemaris TaxID=126734 RepID=A0A8A3S9F1_9EURY|nr:HEPN domain-containing protein [Methanofollis aquaemaris]QSZ68116.1 HEPN domain-containing protein [Methanofollis aquaemaris]